MRRANGGTGELSHVQEIRYAEEVPAIDTYYEMFCETGWNERLRLSKTQLEQALQGSWYSVCAYDDRDRLVGTGRLVSDGAYECFVCDVMVDPGGQGHGIGRGIVDRLLAHAKSRGIPWVQVTVAEGKSGFYGRLGFEPRPDDAPGMDIWFTAQGHQDQGPH